MRLKRRLVLGGLVIVLCALFTSISILWNLDHSAEISSGSHRVYHVSIPGRPRQIHHHHRKNKRLQTLNLTGQVMDSDRALEVVDQTGEQLLEDKKNSLVIQRIPSDEEKDLRAKVDKNIFTRNSSERYPSPCTLKKPDRQIDDQGYSDLAKLVLPEPSTAKKRRMIQDILGIHPQETFSNLEFFYLKISEKDLYEQNDPTVDTLLKDLATQSIVYVVEKQGGTQLKLVLTYEDGGQAMFKPMRFPREKETDPNHFYFVDFERHVSEIAAFHLDRILEFRRCPPVTGRLLNITSEIYAQTDDDLLKTFFISPAGNLCFHGHCSVYCDTAHAICGHPFMLEGSLAAFLPPKSLSPRKAWRNPWKRSYHKHRKADWENNDLFCDDVRRNPPYNIPSRLADIIDMSILDFMIGNMDRHHYETFLLFGNDSFILHLDHGRGFGLPNHDELSILAPLYQCCFIRSVTFRRLLELQGGSRPLSSRMRCSLSRDPLFPVLTEAHLRALDRRLIIVLEVIKYCLQRVKPSEMFFGDK